MKNPKTKEAVCSDFDSYGLGNENYGAKNRKLPTGKLLEQKSRLIATVDGYQDEFFRGK